jgi:hypothetical protein
MAKAVVAKILSHWDGSFENFQASPLEFYDRVEQAIIDRGVSGIKLSRVTRREGPRWASRREYLRVERKELVFDICAAPSGNDLSLSWWLGQKPPSLLSETPFFGALFGLFRGETTYYEADMQVLFQRAVHESVLKVAAELTREAGINRRWASDERIPLMREFFDETCNDKS